MVTGSGFKCRICGEDLGDNIPVDSICSFCADHKSDKPVDKPAGKFIVFEGMDGSGKSTQLEWAIQFLQKDYLGVENVLITKEPSENPIGQVIRSFLRKEFYCNAAVKQITFIADRGLHLETEIKPALEAGTWVLCDRYILSTMVYGALEELPVDLLYMINFNLCQFPKPDLTILFDLPPEEAHKRLSEKGTSLEYFEEVEKLKKIQGLYLELLEWFFPTATINANAARVDMREKIENLLLRTFFNEIFVANEVKRAKETLYGPYPY